MVNARDGLTYVWIPAGRFSMGCSPGDPDCDTDEQPVHAVTIEKGFWIGQTEATTAAYRRVTGRGADDRGDDTRPAAGVTWMEAKAFCESAGGRLPTEAEWEYAARAGTTTRFYGPPQEVAWYEANSGEQAHAAGTKPANAFGLHDMLGNVAEWVRDRYYNRYDDSVDDSTPEEPLASNATAVARGGSWFSELTGVRVSRRLEMYPDAAEPIIGFRCARDMP
jgi:formylglycine-generating enzyme required for sulfatase activity